MSTIIGAPATVSAPDQPAENPSANTTGAQSTVAQTNVYAVHGADPEVQAYAMAKYSRSALSMKESLRELNEQKAEQFLNTFYFQYGHRSIADLAHIAFAIEKLSLLAAIELVDEQRWDGQERSTRYQNFKKSGWYSPDFAPQAAQQRQVYEDTCKFLFAEYEFFSDAMFHHLAGRTPKPAGMDQGQYDRILKARAFDISRYVLPLATNTSLGQIVNARTLETQISRLLGHAHAEVRQLGDLLKQASRGPSFNVNAERMEQALAKVRAIAPELAEELRPELLREVRVSPTLVKYAAASEYAARTNLELLQAERELMQGAAIEKVRPVELLEADPLEVELAATLLYGVSHYPYKQLRRSVASLGEKQRAELVDLGLRHRGKHDELPRAFSAGQRFRFDVLMDVGGFRDMHRHRRCTQTMQDYTLAHGYDTPEEVRAGGLAERYDGIFARVQKATCQVSEGAAPHDKLWQYLLPLAQRRRCLFAMDFAETVYISELRTTPAGHWSYREVAYAMYEEVARKFPAMAKYFRVTDVKVPVDLLQR